MGKLRRQHIKDQVDTIAKLIDVAPESIKADASGVVIAPEQMDKLLKIVSEKTTRTTRAPRTKVSA